MVYNHLMTHTQTAQLTDTTTPTADMLEDRVIDGRKVRGYIKAEYQDTLISTHFSTGTKVHAGRLGSSVAVCGGWMRFSAGSYRQYTQPDCKRCLKALGVEVAPAVKVAPAPVYVRVPVEATPEQHAAIKAFYAGKSTETYAAMKATMDHDMAYTTYAREQGWGE